MMRYEGSRMNKPRQSLPILQTTGTVSPFYIPPDDEIFESKERMNKTRKDLFYRRNKLKIWERDVSKQGLSIKDLNQIGEGAGVSSASSISLNYPVNLMKATKLSLQNNIHRSESMTTYLARKKQILRYQLKIGNKREEITNLQECVKSKENALKNCQNFLEEDISNFNSYLNLNKLEVRKVIKDSEEKAKQKNDRIRILKEKLEVKTDLTGKINSKIEVIENLIKYKRFLEDFNNISKVGRLSQGKSNSDLSDTQPNPSSTVISEKEVAYLKKNFSISTELQKYLENQNQKENLKFQTPSQLMSMFVNLQEANLSCITSLNSIEERMEAVKGKYHDKKVKMSAHKSQLISDKIELIKQVAAVEKEIEYLKVVTSKENKELESGIQGQIYEKYKDFQTKPIPIELRSMPLQILKDIQKKLQSLSKHLNDAREQRPQYIQTLEKNCFLQKREKKKIKLSEKEEYLLKMEEREAEMNKEKREKKKRRKVMRKMVINREARHEKSPHDETDEEEMDTRKYLL